MIIGCLVHNDAKTYEYESCNLFQPLVMLALTVIYFQVDYSFKDETDQERYVFWAHCKLNDILCYSLF